MFKPLVNKLNKPIIALLVSAGVLASVLPVYAHHAFSAEFDAEKPIEVKGVITKFALTNPHSWLYVDVKGPDGKVTNWGFEFGAPFGLFEKGINKKTLLPGLEITVKGYRAKSGESFAYATSTVLADGRSFSTGGAPDAPSAKPVTPAGN